jgi:hypothetical protein
MSQVCLRLFLAFFLLMPVVAHADLPESASATAPTAEDLEFFEKEVRPILVNQCFNCHSTGKKQKGGLLLDSREGLLAGGDNGESIVPGKSSESRLIQAIGYQDADLKMPPKGKLKDEEIAALTKWVDRGAPWPATVNPTGAPAPKAEFNITERAKRWSYQPVRQDVPLPMVKQADWPAQDCDRFILAALEAKGIAPAGPADKRTLLRRVTFDLIGLPPTAAEIDAFLADNSPNAFEKVVDRLLDSPFYGERWGRHWLDLVRYAETQGHEFDYEIPNAWRYRDYVIRAFNQDLPYDQFVTEHIAGDLMPNPRRNPTEKFNESIIGTGFYWLGEGKHSPVDVRAEEGNRIDNQIDVLCKTFLGMTVSCARCHDHKFDPISTKDYYGLAGFFQSSRMQQAFIDDPEPWKKRLDELLKAQTRLAEARRKVISSGRKDQLRGFWSKFSQIVVMNANELEVVKKQAIEAGIKPDTVAAVAQLREQAMNDVAHPLHALVKMSLFPSEKFAESRKEFAESLIQLYQKSRLDHAEDIVFSEFNKPGFGNWFVTGQAFGDRPLTSKDVDRINLVRPSDPLSLVRGIYHSGALSPRLRGVLRSPTFTIERPRVWMRVAGKDTKIRLVIDEFHLIQYPIYGGLAVAPPQAEKFSWVEMDVSMWQGHRGYLEFNDDSDGFIAVDRIVFANGGPPPDILQSVTSRLVVGDENLKTFADVQAAYQKLLSEAAADLGSNSIHEENLSELAAWLGRDHVLGSVAELIDRQPESTKAELKQLANQVSQLEAALPVPARAIAMADGNPENERVFIRGNHKTLGDEVPRRMPEVLQANQAPIDSAIEGSGRLELARRMTDPKNPVIARIIVNRVWLHHFGEGIVRSPDDFGYMGQDPSHPELLDYLAAEFVRDGWSIKRLHRRLLLSRSYQMSSHADPEAEAADVQNRLWHRMPIQRLEAEIVRDSILAVSGRLVKSQYGPSVMPYITAYMNGRGRPSTGPLDGDGRRSVYINVRRNFMTPMLLAFDFPIPFTTIGRRTVSNVPAQALCLMNNQFVLQQADHWAKRLLAEGDRKIEDRIREMYVTAFARTPTDEELSEGVEFIQAQGKLYPQDQSNMAWTDFAHVLFNYKEFVFVK